MDSKKFVCDWCEAVVDPTATRCGVCLTEFADRPYREVVPRSAPEQVLDESPVDDASEVTRCPRDECRGSLVASVCQLCQLSGFLRYQLPFEQRPQTLVAGESVQLGREVGPFAEKLSRYPNISGKHCKLDLTGSHPTVIDLDSLNGTYVDGALVPKGPEGTRLAANSVIRLGRDRPEKRLSSVEIRILP